MAWYEVVGIAIWAVSVVCYVCLAKFLRELAQWPYSNAWD